MTNRLERSSIHDASFKAAYYGIGLVTGAHYVFGLANPYILATLAGVPTFLKYYGGKVCSSLCSRQITPLQAPVQSSQSSSTPSSGTTSSALNTSITALPATDIAPVQSPQSSSSSSSSASPSALNTSITALPAADIAPVQSPQSSSNLSSGSTLPAVRRQSTRSSSTLPAVRRQSTRSSSTLPAVRRQSTRSDPAAAAAATSTSITDTSDNDDDIKVPQNTTNEHPPQYPGVRPGPNRLQTTLQAVNNFLVKQLSRCLTACRINAASSEALPECITKLLEVYNIRGTETAYSLIYRMSEADLKHLNSYRDQNGNTFLHLVILNRLFPKFGILLLHKLTKDTLQAQNKDGYTALDLCKMDIEKRPKDSLFRGLERHLKNQIDFLNSRD